MRKILFIIQVVVLVSGCATLETSTDKKRRNTTHETEQGTPPNQYGWDDSNCAHIKADGHCAHGTGANASDFEPPNANGGSAANCAHITADGTCAHEL